MFPSSEEHSITLPIVDPSLDSPQLPLVFNVLALYWGEDLSSHITEEIRVKYEGVRGSVLNRRNRSCRKERLPISDVQKQHEGSQKDN